MTMPERQTIAVAADRGGVFATLQSAADRLALLAAYLAALCLAGLIALASAEIILALLSRFSARVPAGLGIAWEYSAYLMGIAFLLGSGLTLRAGMHVRVELLLRGAGARYAWACEAISALIGSAFSVILAWTLTAFALQSHGAGQVSGDSATPLWIPQAALAFGATVLAVQMLLRLAACILGRELERATLGAATLPE